MLDGGSIAATRDRWTTSIRRSRTERTGAAEAAVLSRWIVVVLACLGYSRSELRVGGENIRVRKRKRSYQFHQRWRATSEYAATRLYPLILRIRRCRRTAQSEMCTPQRAAGTRPASGQL